jgi:hypothetical protein
MRYVSPISVLKSIRDMNFGLPTARRYVMCERINRQLACDFCCCLGKTLIYKPLLSTEISSVHWLSYYFNQTSRSTGKLSRGD